jgi:uncharacterized membrane protein
MMPLIAAVQWRPHLPAVWAGVVLLGLGVWLYVLHRRLLRRLPARKAQWLLVPKLAAVMLLVLALFDPVSAIQKSESARGKLLVVVDASSSMEVVDDYQRSRAARARQLVEQWKGALPSGLMLDQLEFDTSVHKPGAPVGDAVRGTDLGGCLLTLAERGDISSYLGVVLLTDGGDEVVQSAALPKAPLYMVGVGAEPSTWNDLALSDVQCPPTAEKDVDFEITADIQAQAGHGQGFAQKVAQVRVLLERAAGSNAWEKVAEQNIDLSNLRARARIPARSSQTGIQHYRVTVVPVSGELSLLNNSRVLTVNVQKKALHVLFFTRELGQEFKVLRNELARDPGISFTALFRTTGNRFTLQGDRIPGDDSLAGGFPSMRKDLEPYDAIIIGSFPAEDCTPQQMQALIQYVEEGGTLIFLGGDRSFGRGGYAQTSLAPLFPWRLSEREPEPEHGTFIVRVPPMGLGHPILATIEETLTRTSATLESVNALVDPKPGAIALLTARVGTRDLTIVAVQPFGKGKVMGIASNTLWKWAAQPEPLRSAYGLFWRQAVRQLTGKTEGGQNLAVRWDKDSYQPGEEAVAEIRVTGNVPGALRLAAGATINGQTAPIPVEPVPGQSQTFQIKLRFRQRGDCAFRLVAYRGERVLETYEKSFSVAPLAAEGSHLELDEGFLRKLAEQGGGAYYHESEAGQLLERLSGKHTRKVTVQKSSLVEVGPWFAGAFLFVLVCEWTLRRRMNLF